VAAQHQHWVLMVWKLVVVPLMAHGLLASLHFPALAVAVVVVVVVLPPLLLMVVGLLLQLL
jgi:hypothetical protein